MVTHLVTITTPTEPSTIAKRTLFRVALCIAMVGSVIVSTILFLHGGLALGHLRYFIDIGQHPLHITSSFILVFGFLSLLTFIILTIGLIKVNRTYAIVAAGLLIICSLSLIIFSIWSFITISSGQLPKSINNTLVKEIDQTQYNVVVGNNIIVDNTLKMANLEKQHQCCGLVDPIEDYRSRQPSIFGSSSSSSSSSNGGNTKGRTTNSQKNPSHYASSVLLPISCCNEKYRSNENNLCLDVSGNTTNPLNRYNTGGCYTIIVGEKFQRIQQQGFITIVASCLAVISCIALAAVIRLLGEGYRVVPVRTAT
ncbi:unnamed protein product [Adineta steineri]|uniref:Tetraspanin n=1 Tax=Adineta steineri TaxID=433720 RepID=A0A816CPP8_9BILA|nr:unnamed protein product [Adineta steineri]CAF1624589.1 unnamed protein product [Adineta steineri]